MLVPLARMRDQNLTIKLANLPGTRYGTLAPNFKLTLMTTLYPSFLARAELAPVNRLRMRLNYSD